MKYVVFTSLWPSTIKILISNWPRTRKFTQRRPFLTTVMGWSRFTSNFYALIGQNLTGEFMGKIYAASWNLFTLTAEAERVLCQLVMFLTVFFHCIYKMKYSCYQELSVIRDWFVYWVFGWLIAKIAASEASPAVAWGGERAVERGDMPLMPPRRRSNSIPWCIFPEASRNIAVMADSIVKYCRFLVCFFLISVPVKVRKLHYFVIWHDFFDWQWLKSKVSI